MDGTQDSTVGASDCDPRLNATSRAEDPSPEAIEELTAAIVAAGPAPSGRREDVSESKTETTSEQEKVSVTAKIDEVDPLARIAQLEKMKAEMEKNFRALKHVYGGKKPPPRVEPADSAHD